MSGDDLVLVTVIAVRLAVPLLILRYPLPGILAAILADSLDGAIFSGLAGGPLDGYQNFDKALDTWYLAFAYFATVRNWTDPTAIGLGRLLFYYRLIGVAAFSLTDDRLWLFLFPAVFEVYFIAYEVVRSRWSPTRLRPAHLLALAGGSLVLIKLPQEYWVHVAQGSTTEWLKQRVFGVEASASRLEAIAADPGAAVMLVVLLAGVAVLGRIAMALAPPPDHPVRFAADPPTRRSIGRSGERVSPWEFRRALAEKVAITAMLGLVFAEYLPGIDASAPQMAAAAAIAVVVGAALNARSAPRDGGAHAMLLQFGWLAAAGLPALVVVAAVTDFTVDAATAVFYVLLFCMLIIGFDHADAIRLGRRPEEPTPDMGPEAPATQGEGRLGA